MKISVIIPFYKGLSFLEDCLQSLVEQSYQDMEIILVCDNVEEDIDTFIKDYQSLSMLKAYHLEEKTGVAAARNYGLSVATGEYIYFLDSDDYLDSETLRLLVATAEQTNADVIYGKKTWTWFSRSLYLRKLYDDESESEEEEDDEEDEGEEGEEGEDEGDETSSNDSNQSNLESGGKAEKDSSIDDDDQMADGLDADMASDSLEETEEADEQSLSEEERNVLWQEKLLAKQRSAYYELVARRKSVRNITVLHVLMKRSLIAENGICFNEDIIFLSDYPFLLQVLSVAEYFERNMAAVYIKRRHNDSINLPSLGQRKGSKNFKEYVKTYEYAKTLLKPDSDLRLRLDKKMIHYCIRYFGPQLKKARRIRVRNERFAIIHRLISQMDKKLICSYKRYKRRLLLTYYKGDINKAIRIVKLHLKWVKLKKITRNKRALIKFLYMRFFLRKPVMHNWVFCESFFGKSYSDSPKYVYEYLQRNYPGKYRFIWVIDKKHTKIPYKHTKVKRFSIRYVYYLARCKYYIFNGRQPEWIKKRKQNVFLQTWHGTPLKRLVFDLEDINSATPRYKRQTYKQSRAWDYLVAANQYSSDIFRRCFLYEKTMLETGYPRNDIMHYDNKEQIAAQLRKKLGIPADKKTILYAPTWRDDEYYVKGQYKFFLKLDLNLIKEKLGKEYVILLRTHYFIADSLDVTGLEGFAYNFSDYDDISELYLISDILITDYSSVFFDYGNLKRPMLFYTYDLEKYRDVLRGFYIDIEEELPGPLVFTTEEVIDAVQRIDQLTNEYQDKYDAFYEKFCSWEDGQASRKVANAVFELGETM